MQWSTCGRRSAHRRPDGRDFLASWAGIFRPGRLFDASAGNRTTVGRAGGQGIDDCWQQQLPQLLPHVPDCCPDLTIGSFCAETLSRTVTTTPPICPMGLACHWHSPSFPVRPPSQNPTTLFDAFSSKQATFPYYYLLLLFILKNTHLTLSVWIDHWSIHLLGGRYGGNTPSFFSSSRAAQGLQGIVRFPSRTRTTSRGFESSSFIAGECDAALCFARSRRKPLNMPD